MPIARDTTERSLPFCRQFFNDGQEIVILIAVAISGELLAIIESKMTPYVASLKNLFG
jgi:hypothetical protein